MDDAIRNAAAKAEVSPPATSDEKILIELAELTPIEYDRVREAKAKQLKIRVSTLDDQVRELRPPPVATDKKSGQAITIADDAPWPDAVDGAQLLVDLAELYEAHVILPKGGADTTALWSLGTYCFEVFDIFPRLAAMSPVKRCGKTTFLDMLEMSANRAMRTGSISTAAMFRVVEACKPTLLIDEIDTFLKANQELRGIINVGHKKGSKVTRIAGDDLEVRQYNCYAPVVLAGIGRVPDTIEDRTIEIKLIRALQSDRLQRITRNTRRQAEILRRKATRWAHDNAAALANLDPEMPKHLYNREADNWRPLFAIAQLVGGEWPKLVNWCARRMRPAGDSDDALASLALLHIREYFTSAEVSMATNKAVVASLLQRDDAAWMEVPPKGKELTTQRLGILLKEFKIKSKQGQGLDLDDDGKKKRWYHYEDFEDAFARYLP